MTEKYKFEFGQQVEFIVKVGPFDEPKTRTMRGFVSGRYTGPMGGVSYEVTLNSVKKPGRSVPVYRGVGERDMKEDEG